MPDFKEVTINGAEFRVGKLKAQDGGWVAILLTGKMREQSIREQAATPAKARKAAKQEADETAATLTHEEGMMMTAVFLIAQLSRSELADVQTMCLARCFQRQELAGGVVNMPVMEDGRWLVPELEYDGHTILELTKHSLAFNIAPFFPAPESR